MIPFFVMHRRELLTGIVALVALYGRAPRSTASMTTDLWVDTPFSADDIPDVWNSDPLRHAIVTGANTGILQLQYTAHEKWHAWGEMSFLMCVLVALPHSLLRQKYSDFI